MVETTTSNLITPIVRLTFCSLFSARMPSKTPKSGDRARYSTTALILPRDKYGPKDQERLDAMLKAGLEVGCSSELGKDRFVAMVKDGKIKILRTDIESSGFPLEFKYFFRPWTFGIGARKAEGGQPAVLGAPPGIVSEYKDPVTGKAIPITDPNKVYSGCWARLSVKPFYTNYEKTNPAISWNLSNVQILAKPPEGYSADRLDGKVDATDEFDATEEMAQVDLAALTSGAPANGGAANDADELARLLGG